jgi:hypothetical protein
MRTEDSDPAVRCHRRMISSDYELREEGLEREAITELSRR